MRNIFAVLLLVIITIFPVTAKAIPTMQTYIEGGTAADYHGDQDTWFSFTNTFTLYVSVAYDMNVENVSDVTLLVSVPDGETGNINFTPLYGDDAPDLLTLAEVDGNPSMSADTEILEDVTGFSGYATINDPTFLPDDFNLNNHYPLHDDVSDFLIYDLGFFDNSDSGLLNYNADDGGSITPTSAIGQVKEYLVSYEGFSGIHIDAYGLVTSSNGDKIKATWENNPGSHDATSTVPEPSTLLLLSLGMAGFVVFQRKLAVHK